MYVNKNPISNLCVFNICFKKNKNNLVLQKKFIPQTIYHQLWLNKYNFLIKPSTIFLYFTYLSTIFLFLLSQICVIFVPIVSQNEHKHVV